MNKNLRAFLDMLAISEGTSTSKFTKNNGYDIIVGGINSPNTFTDYSKHPNVLVTVNKAGLKSTAAGRYQSLFKWWKAYTEQLGLHGFTPEVQDAIAIQQIKERKALPDIYAGNFESAIAKCSNIWASLPGNNYGQFQHPMSKLVDVCNDCLRKLG